MSVSAGVGPTVARAPFGAIGGVVVDQVTIQVGAVTLRAIDYGGIIVGLDVPDRDGRSADVVLGHDTLEGYVEHSPYFGAIIGRYGNRIAGGRFTLDGRQYQLARNDGEQHLHGGARGFDKALWSMATFEREHDAGVTFALTSPDGDEGYPGRLQAQVTYTLTAQRELVVDYLATTDHATIVNLTQHSYFDLSAGESDVLSHELTIDAGRFTPVDATLIPTGELAPVAGTPFDFRSPAPIGARIDVPHAQLRFAGGYDHNFVLERPPSSRALAHAARVREPGSGRVLDVHTTEPGLQFYSGNFLDGTIRGKHGRVYGHRSGLCLETQHFPDSPNKPQFPTVVLRPGEELRSRTVFTFSVDR
jgi:aldose 1-epimerase